MNRKLNDPRSYNRPRMFDRGDFRGRLEHARGGCRANSEGFRNNFRGNIAGFRDDLKRRDAGRDKPKQYIRESSLQENPGKDNFSENFHERQVDYRKDVHTNKPESKLDSQREAF